MLARTYVLGNRPKDAVPILTTLTRSCQALDDGVIHTWGFAWLARALEPTDAEGACKAWQVVLDRWGKSPLSRTAELARTRRTALSCKAT